MMIVMMMIMIMIMLRVRSCNYLLCARHGRRSVPSHVPSQRLTGSEFQPTYGTLVNFPSLLDLEIRRCCLGWNLDGSGNWHDLVGLLLFWFLDGGGGDRLGLFMAGTVAAEGLKRRESPITSLALVNIKPTFSDLKIESFGRKSVDFDTLLKNLPRPAVAVSLSQKNQAIGHILLFLSTNLMMINDIINLAGDRRGGSKFLSSAAAARGGGSSIGTTTKKPETLVPAAFNRNEMMNLIVRSHKVFWGFHESNKNQNFGSKEVRKVREREREKEVRSERVGNG